jgi:hypothetical protein
MAFDVTTSEIQSVHLAEKRLAGSFLVNGASAPVAAEIYGNWIESIAHTATGVWTITIKSRYRSSFGLLAAFVSLMEASGVGSVVELESVDLSAGTVVVNAFEDGTDSGHVASDLVDGDDRISVELVIQSTSIHDGSGL